MNLKEQFPKYKIERENGAYVIQCRNGQISRYGAIMTATTDRNTPAARRLISLPCITSAEIDGSLLRVTFRPEDLPAVAKSMKPRIRRKLSPEHRAKLIAAGKPFLKHAARRPQDAPGIAPVA